MNSCNPHNAYNNTMFNCFIRIEVAAKNTCQYQYMNKTTSLPQPFPPPPLVSEYNNSQETQLLKHHQGTPHEGATGERHYGAPQGMSTRTY